MEQWETVEAALRTISVLFGGAGESVTAYQAAKAWKVTPKTAMKRLRRYANVGFIHCDEVSHRPNRTKFIFTWNERFEKQAVFQIGYSNRQQYIDLIKF
jgi:hypothetical protein